MRGCVLAEALRDLGYPTHPYDWLITTQTFIINSFNDFYIFFCFDEKYECGSMLLDENKKAIMLHDFQNFILEKSQVIKKYKRRFDRLNENLNSNDNILLVRVYDNLNEELIPKDFYNNILIRDEENIEKWEEFIYNIQSKYNNNIKLLIITNNQVICNRNYNNIILHFSNELRNNKIFYNIIQSTMNSAF